MKTAISLNDELSAQADETARQLGISRSRLFSLALEDYLRQRRQADTIERLNRAYAGEPDQVERRTVAKFKIKLRPTVKDAW